MGFFTAIANSDTDGRIKLSRPKRTGMFTGLNIFRLLVKDVKPLRVKERTRIKFLMLNASVNFRDVVNEARSVILCGGTMQPV